MPDQYLLPADFRIVSGGQTGADSAALDWAIENGVAHGGWCPKGRKSEDGKISPRYLLNETPAAGYLERTEWNVRDSDATVIFTMEEELDGGSKRTAELAEKLGKPWRHFFPRVHPKFLARFLANHDVRILNVAGKRASAARGIGDLVTKTFNAALCVPDVKSAAE
jgi:hypothetical protein